MTPRARPFVQNVPSIVPKTICNQINPTENSWTQRHPYIYIYILGRPRLGIYKDRLILFVEIERENNRLRVIILGTVTTINSA